MEQLLYNLNMERSVLSSILFDPVNYNHTAERLKAADFYLQAHQDIFAAFDELAAKQTPLDEQFLKKALEKDKKYNEEAILDILAASPLGNTYAYIAEIKEFALKREMIRLTTEIKQVIYEEQLESVEAIDRVQKRLFELGSDTSNKQFRDAEEIVSATLKRINDNKERGNSGVIGLNTGFTDLNRMTQGFNNGDMIVLGARPSMGKTAFAMNLAANILRNGDGVAVFSLEMSAEDLMLRLLAIETGFTMSHIKLGNLNDKEWGLLGERADFFARSKFFVDDDSNLTIGKLRSRLRHLKMRCEDVKFAIVDYIGLMAEQGRIDRQQQVSEISRGIKILARELDIPILVLTQLNRGLENRDEKRPKLADIRESGSIEQDADIVMFVHREDVYKKLEDKERKKKADKEGKSFTPEYVEKPEEEAEIIIEKHRNGATGIIKMIFKKSCTKFIETAKSKFEPITYKDTQIQIDMSHI
ncbi:MAG: replicative DNA helicase [Helicobacteraceae bacterium]|jgi:replicative DNA helicase|nr:replicative DNA helicase [Helicobacteraceae bacterium]